MRDGPSLDRVTGPTPYMSNTLARNSGLNLVAGLCTTFGAFVSNIIIARLLGVEGNGVVAFAIWLATVAAIACDLGSSGALIRYVPELQSRGREQDVSGLTWFLFRRLALATVLVGFGLCLYAAWISWRADFRGWNWWLSGSDFASQPLFWILVSAATAAQTCVGFVNGAFQGFQNFRPPALPNSKRSTMRGDQVVPSSSVCAHPASRTPARHSSSWTGAFQKERARQNTAKENDYQSASRLICSFRTSARSCIVQSVPCA
jgi:hypothetical protein